MSSPNPILARLQEWEKANPLRTWRAENKVSRQTVAGALGVTHTAVVAWEAGSNRPTEDHLAAIARLLGVTQDDLAGKWDAWRSSSPASA